MVDGVEFRLDGFEELNRQLAEFQGNALRRVITKATRAGLKNTLKTVRTKAKRLDNRQTPENIAKNIQIQINSKSFRRNGEIIGRIGVEGGAKQDGNIGRSGDTFYWRFLEFGTSHIQARPFMRGSMDPEEATLSFKTALAAAIELEISRNRGSA